MADNDLPEHAVGFVGTHDRQPCLEKFLVMDVSKITVGKIAGLALSFAVVRFGMAGVPSAPAVSSVAQGGAPRATAKDKEVGQLYGGVAGKAHRALSNEGATRAPVIAAYGNLPLSFRGECRSGPPRYSFSPVVWAIRCTLRS